MVVLGRTIKWCSWGLEYKADPGHREKLMKLFGFEENTSGSATTGEREKDEGEEEEELERSEAKEYRGGVALLNYYAQDCLEMQFPAKESSRDMAKPKPRSWAKLKRAVRFLVGRKAVMWKFELQAEGQEITVVTDSAWGGSREDRKSTSGGAVMYGKHCWRTWATTQGAVALSSAEAEFYAMADGTLKGKWARTLATEVGVRVGEEKIVVKVDSEAAKSFVNRRGLGNMRHIEVRDLCLQEVIRKGKVKVIKIPGKENPADLMTKFLKKSEVIERLAGLGIEWIEQEELEGNGKEAKGERKKWADMEDEKGE